MHDAIAVGVPVFAIFAGILFNRSDIRDLRAEMSARFDKMRAQMEARFNAVDARFDRIDAELRYFHGVTGKLDGRIEALEKRQ